jgi:hypothetical protein
MWNGTKVYRCETIRGNTFERDKVAKTFNGEAKIVRFW